MSTINELYEVLYEHKSVTIACTSKKHFNSTAQQLRKKQRMMNELVGKLYSIRSEWDEAAGTARFYFAPPTEPVTYTILDKGS